MIRAQKTLYASNSMVQRIERIVETAPSPDFSEQIKRLDAQIVSLMNESDRKLRDTFDHTGESRTAANMWTISRIIVHT